jgi:hypothetical protein
VVGLGVDRGAGQYLLNLARRKGVALDPGAA